MIKKVIRRFLHSLGYSIHKFKNIENYKSEFFDCEEEYLKIVNKVQGYTMTDAPAIINLIYATEYLEINKIQGDIVECGVAHGGSMMAVAYLLSTMNSTFRNLYLYDLFYPGMPEGGKFDHFTEGGNATEAFILAGIIYDPSKKEVIKDTLNEVKDLMKNTGYPFERLKFIQGKVEDTIPAVIPDKIALLRLDTDLYESTKHELEQLYPRLADHGVLIIDDYGAFKGARKATDEYFKEKGIPIFLSRVGKTGCRFTIKPKI
ncbi:MAG: TylF/MycF/NovP-related O-methyltransferase [Parafilimonas sp.]